MSAVLERFICWKPERIGQVISKQALVVDRATFLATHVPMRRIADLRRETITDEASLLAELESQGEKDLHTFTVIQGMPGAGKSHLIRWLKEQYAITHPRDAVLLIARENNSLRGTIQQILDANLIDAEFMPEHFKRLQGALEVLQPKILAQKLIDSLKDAVLASDWGAIRERLGTPPSRLSKEKIEYFLLDKNVRDYLQESGRPIDRLTKFLTVGTEDGVGLEVVPGFEVNDLVLSRELRSSIRSKGGYQPVISLCEDLADPVRGEEMREWLTSYLNFLFKENAIGSATQLAAGDLRVLFNDLRRALLRTGKHLACFIEDITTFTGLDRGMIEALTVEHREQGKETLCRLLSVVGITDGYYSRDFPDNMKDRVSHRFALSEEGGTSSRREAEDMKDPAYRSELAARYLNAIRLSHSELEQWLYDGANHDALPNFCDRCPKRESCHATFGAVAATKENADSNPIGLYPFNQNALDTLYTFLRPDRSRNQRTFLADIVGHILQFHGELIEAGDFPPPASELAAAVEPPGLNPPAHERIILEQGQDQAQRLRTLFIFWGDRNVSRVNAPTNSEVGGVPNALFKAFDLRVIEGIQGATPPPPPPPPPPPIIGPKPVIVIPPPPPPPPPPPIVGPRSKYTKNIESWANGGPMGNYGELIDSLNTTMSDYIDWQAYNISSNQVKAYFNRRTIVIEGQAGSGSASHRYTLPRTPEVRSLLDAISDLYTANPTLTPSEYGETLTTISTWLRSHEAEIVEFVRNPDKLPLTGDKLAQLLVENAAMLALLDGEIKPGTATDVRTLSPSHGKL